MEQETQVTSLISLNNSGLPTWIHIMPAGTFMADDGRGPFVLKDPASVIKASLRPKVDMVVDRDHDLVFAEGKNVPAAGWVKDIEFREDGLWAKVEWTATAIQQIKAKEYRYISPVFTHNKGEITRILHISLVNSPALELTAVATKKIKSINNNHKKEEKTMDKKQMEALALSLGLEKDADVDAIVTAAKKQQDALDKAKADIEAMALKNKEKTETSKAKPDPAEYVPMSVFEETNAQVASLRKQLAEDKAKDAVDKAVTAGKITPAQKEWATEYASSDPKGFEAFIKNQVSVIAGGEKEETSKKLANDAGELTAAQAIACKQLGLTKEHFLGKTKE